jgi:hypothetical protein
MTLKMIDIINFNVFYDEVRTNKMPLKVAFKLSNLVKAINEKTDFYREEIQKILQEYGEFDENGNIITINNGNGIKVKPGTEIECTAKINELQSLDVDLPDITFDIEEFGDIEMTLEIFNIITPFLKAE